jgi:hypothetical protein
VCEKDKTSLFKIITMSTSKIKNFQDYADRILPQPGTQADIDALENLPSQERNAIVFVVAYWYVG